MFDNDRHDLPEPLTPDFRRAFLGERDPDAPTPTPTPAWAPAPAEASSWTSAASEADAPGLDPRPECPAAPRADRAARRRGCDVGGRRRGPVGRARRRRDRRARRGSVGALVHGRRDGAPPAAVTVAGCDDGAERPELTDVVASVRDSVVTITSEGFSSRGFAPDPVDRRRVGRDPDGRRLHPDQPARRRRQPVADRRAGRRAPVPGDHRQGVGREGPRPGQDRRHAA